MALRFSFKKNFQGVLLDSGRIYSFAYSAYQHDPNPLIIYLYWVSGTHPQTKRQWRFIQAINLNYISRANRQKFVEDWVETLYTTRNVKLTWNKVKTRWPEMAFATRRYFYSPSYYIKSLQAIPLDQTQQVVVGSLQKDFSTAQRIMRWTGLRALQKKYSAIMARRRARR
jgi:hypothetical protein